MSRKAALYCEPETENLVTAPKSVTIGVEIDPAGTFVLSLPSVGDVWPGDTLEWNVSKATGATGLKDKTLTIGIHRIGVLVTAKCPSDSFSLQQVLPGTITEDTRDPAIDGTDGPNDAKHHRVGAGHKIKFDGKALARKPSTAGSYLVIDTSGPPAGGGGGGGGTGGQPCRWPGDSGESERRGHPSVVG